MCQYNLYLYLPCCHVRWTRTRNCDYLTKMRIGPSPSILFGKSSLLCPHWEKAPGQQVNVCLTTHYPCYECEELSKTRKPVLEASKVLSTHDSIPSPVSPLSRSGAPPTRPPANPRSEKSNSGKRRQTKAGGPPLTVHTNFDGTSKGPEKRRPGAPDRQASKFKEEFAVPMTRYADLDKPMPWVPGAREKLVKELQDLMQEQKAKEQRMKEELEAKEARMKKELDKGDQRIKALMAALYDEL